MSVKVTFFSILATALGINVLLDQPRHAIGRIPSSRRSDTRDVYEFLGKEPYLRGSAPYLRGAEDFIKLPKELFVKWFAQNHPGDKFLNEDNLPQPTDITMEHIGPPMAPLPNTNSTDDVESLDEKPDDLSNPEVPKDNAEKKVDDLKSEDNSRYLNDYNSNSYAAKPLHVNVNNNHGSSELAVKQKLLQLIRNTKSSIDKKIEPIQAVHDAYKMNRIYKIGYLVSNINRTRESLKEFYNDVERNMKYWDVLKALNAYDQVKTADEFLSKALYILNLVGATSPYQTTRVLAAVKPHSPFTTTSRHEDVEVTDRLAWSYYDDSM